MARITVRVHPRAKRTRIAGKLGEEYKLDLAAPPVDGKANQACIRFLADLAGVPAPRVRIVLGLTNRTKVMELEGVSQEVVDGKLRACSTASY
jgi:uncharacterized protein (TIGR00251 family)